ncbi:MAG: CopG family transcriptional regulator [Magnetococcales bacterium]|nr:CopG family transcriptional regulator [Magnetococcales bacterium]
MKEEYDFSNGRRGPVNPPVRPVESILFRIDADLYAWFRKCVEDAGGGNYHNMMNDALREYVERQRKPLEETLPL